MGKAERYFWCLGGPTRVQDTAAPVHLSLSDFDESFCPPTALCHGHCPCLLPAGPRAPRKDRVQLLSVFRGPDWPRGCVFSRTCGLQSAAGVRGRRFQTSLPSVCSAPGSHETSPATGLFSLGLTPRVADGAGPPAAFGPGSWMPRGCGSRAGGTWEVHRSRNGDRGGKRAAELKRTVARVRRGVRGSWEWKSGRQSRGRACAVPHVPTPRGRAPPSWSPVRSHRATRWPRAHGVRRRCSG